MTTLYEEDFYIQHLIAAMKLLSPKDCSGTFVEFDMGMSSYSFVHDENSLCW